MPTMPPTPTKAPPKLTLPFSRQNTKKNENENNLTPENIKNVKELSESNLERLVKETLKSPGNTKHPKYSPSVLNYKPEVPKMKLPLHLQDTKMELSNCPKGGKRRKTLRKRRGLRKTRKY